MYKNLVLISLMLLSLILITPPISANKNPEFWLEVTTNKTNYCSTEPIAMVLTVLNQNKQSQKVNFSSGRKFDFILRDYSNKIVWQWSSGKMFMQAFSSVTFEPGTPKTFVEILEQQSLSNTSKLKIGKYKLTGLLTMVENQLESNPIEIEIHP